MKLNRTLLSSFLSLTCAGALLAGAPPQTITISCYDTMKYSVTKIEAQPGQKITIELKNEGNLPKSVMGHDWVLLKAGADAAAYANTAMTAKAEDYHPKSLEGEVLASTPILGSKESAKVSFTAPSAPGSYPYLCAFPGHYASGMKGVLIIR